MDTSNIHDNVEMHHQGDYFEPEEEHKALNVHHEFEPNIRPDGSESSSGQSATHDTDMTLYGFKLRTVCTVVCLALVFSLVSTVLSVFSIIKYKDASKELVASRERRVCLPCQGMNIQSDAWKQKNKAGDCCVKLEDLIVFMDKLASQHATSKMQSLKDELTANRALSTSAAKRVSAHIGYVGSDDGSTWSSDDRGLCHMSPELKLINSTTGEIQVLTAGYYYIYSMITFTYDIPIGNGSPILMHTINVRRPRASYSTRMFRRNEFLWKTSEGRFYSQQASYLGGVKYIPSNQIVFTSVYQPDQLQSCVTEQCYFGLFQV